LVAARQPANVVAPTSTRLRAKMRNHEACQEPGDGVLSMRRYVTPTHSTALTITTVRINHAGIETIRAAARQIHRPAPG
jgi:hypothetical protein